MGSFNQLTAAFNSKEKIGPHSSCALTTIRFHYASLDVMHVLIDG